MAETSEGWDGTVNEASMARILAAAAPPRIVSGFELEVVAGQRRIILSPGESSHGFIRYENDTPRVLDFPAPAAGQWHLVVQRRDWANNTVTTLALPSATTGTAAGSVSLPPAAWPDGFADQPGVLADFPLYWVWVNVVNNEVRWRYASQQPRDEWAYKSGPTVHPGAPAGPFANRWSRGRDSGGTLDAGSNDLGIVIGRTGVYEAVAKQRGNGSNPGAAYIVLALNGNREALETRAGGAWFHDHSSTQYTSSEARYFGPLNAGEILTAGPPAGMGRTLYYGPDGLYGGIWLRRIS